MKITQTTIKNFKRKMAKKAVKYGLWENFGQKELAQLENKYPHLNPGNPIEKHNIQQLYYLDEWLMNFDDKQLKAWKTSLKYE